MVCCAVEREPKNFQYAVRKIPAGRYAKFSITCGQNASAAAVAKAWQEIWKMDLPRTFCCDFEEYQKNGMENVDVFLYIGLKDQTKE